MLFAGAGGLDGNSNSITLGFMPKRNDPCGAKKYLGSQYAMMCEQQQAAMGDDAVRQK